MVLGHLVPRWRCMGLAAAKLNDFIWENFCDWYIEIAKTRLQTGDENVQKVLCYVLSGAMQLLHPFMPFITETIWQALPHEGPSVMVSAWPEYKEELHFAAEEAQMESLMDAVRAIRNRRAEMNVPPSKKAKVLILTEKKEMCIRDRSATARSARRPSVTPPAFRR